MNAPVEPEILPARTNWLVWMVPFLALLVGAYLLHREFADRGPLITVRFEDGTGLEAGTTRLLARGVVVGRVEEVHLSEDLGSVVVKGRLERSAAGLAREGTRIWIVRPQISTSGISGLDTLVRGIHLEMEPGRGPPQRRFTGLESPPVTVADSRAYVLHTPRRGSLQVGVPVIYRGVEIGQVERFALAPDAREVLVHVRIEARYTNLVREGTVFWDAGGVNMRVGLLGARIRTGSLESVLSGAVALAVSPEAAKGSLAPPGSHFVLHPEADDDWLEWQPPIPLPLKEESGPAPAPAPPP